jgi:hypothetical protein
MHENQLVTNYPVIATHAFVRGGAQDDEHPVIPAGSG